MTAAPLNRLTRLARALAVVTTRPPVAMTSTPLQLRNPLNGSGGTTKGARYAANARRVKERAVGRALARRMTPDYTNALPWVVVLTRVSPKPFDSDNLEAAFKSVRDGMAEAWGIDDADPRVTWVTDWRKGAKHAVEAALWVVPEVEAANEHHPEPSMSRVFEQGFDADDYNGRPARTMPELLKALDKAGARLVDPVMERKREMAERGSDLIGSRYEARVTPNVIRVKGGA